MVSLITMRVPGRDLSEGDQHLLPHALDSLRAIHRRGVLHGDVRLANFTVVDAQAARALGESQLKPVVILDFGKASFGGTAREYAEEEEELLEQLQPGCVSAALLQATCRVTAHPRRSLTTGMVNVRRRRSSFG